jgi:hypothetical protein
VANIIEYSHERFSESLKNFENELHGQSSDLPAKFESLLLATQELPSITKMAAYFYQLQKRLWRPHLVRRARFSIGTDRPEPMKPRYKLGQGSIGMAGQRTEVTWERIPTQTSSIIIHNTPLINVGDLIGVLAIVAEPGNKVMEDRLLDRAMTDRLAGWRAALTKVVERVPGNMLWCVCGLPRCTSESPTVRRAWLTRRLEYQVEPHDNEYYTRPGYADARPGVIYTRPLVEQPGTVPHELQQYLQDSHVSSEVLEAVSAALVPLRRSV